MQQNGRHHVDRDQPDPGRQIPHVLSSMWEIKLIEETKNKKREAMSVYTGITANKVW